MAISIAFYKAKGSVIPGFYKLIGMLRQSMRSYRSQLLQMHQQLQLIPRFRQRLDPWKSDSCRGHPRDGFEAFVIILKYVLFQCHSFSTSCSTGYVIFGYIILEFPWHRKVFQSTPPPFSLFNHLCFFTSLRR